VRVGKPVPPCYRSRMPPVPLDEGYPKRRRLGPFWIEDGPALQIAGLIIVLVFAVLFAIAVVFRPT
jgi:hypothetical protein